MKDKFVMASRQSDKVHVDKGGGAGRPAVVILAGFLLLFVAAFARAQTPSVNPPPAPAEGPSAPATTAELLCDHYRGAMDAAEIGRLQRRLIQSAPLRLAEAAHAVRIVNVGDDERIDPYFTPASEGAPPTISVPLSFRWLHCQLVQFGLYNLDARMNELPARQIMDSCLTQTTNVVACIGAIVVAANRQNEGVGPGRAVFTPDARAYVRRMVDNAFFTILLHEFAHLALRHSGRPGEEAEADTYALLATIEGGGVAFPSVWTFSGMAMADPFINGGGLHGRFACRAEVSNDVTHALNNIAGDIANWAENTPDRYLAHRATSAGVRPNRFFVFGDRAGCASGRTSRVLAIARDLENLAGLLDGIARRQPAPAPVAVLQEVVAYRLETQEARNLRMVAISHKLNELSNRVTDDSSRILAFSQGVLEQGASADMRSEDYGRLLAVTAILAHDLAPASSDQDVLDSELRRQLLRAEYHTPDRAVLNLHLGLLDYRAGHCAEGRERFQRLAGVQMPEEMRALIAPMMEPMDAGECAATTQRLRENNRASRSRR